MTPRPKFLLWALCLWGCLPTGGWPASRPIPSTLRQLAVEAQSPNAWARLRNYAQSQKDPEWRGWAYFLAGYAEYRGDSFAEAARDLHGAADSGFSLADYAAYYQAKLTNAIVTHSGGSTSLQLPSSNGVVNITIAPDQSSGKTAITISSFGR